jgi:hypothetical protein
MICQMDLDKQARSALHGGLSRLENVWAELGLQGNLREQRLNEVRI